jgi:hypothetical protein
MRRSWGPLTLALWPAFPQCLFGLLRESSAEPTTTAARVAAILDGRPTPEVVAPMEPRRRHPIGRRGTHPIFTAEEERHEQERAQRHS